MSKAYLNEEAKLAVTNFPKWSFDDCYKIREILYDKGYFINCVSRMGCDRKYHDSWQVQRGDVPQIIEQLFRQRLVVEVQAEGSYKAAITFVYDYHASTIIDAVSRFQKNKGGF